MRSPEIKNGLIALFVICVGFSYLIFFSDMPGGRRYEKKGFDAAAKVLLGDYLGAQKRNFKQNGKYEKDLHHSVEFNQSDLVKLGFRDDPTVAKFCKDCELSEKAFKIAAYGTYRSHEVVWTIDDSGNLVQVQE